MVAALERHIDIHQQSGKGPKVFPMSAYNSVVKNTYSRCHKDACIQISIGNTEWLLR